MAHLKHTLSSPEIERLHIEKRNFRRKGRSMTDFQGSRRSIQSHRWHGCTHPRVRALRFSCAGGSFRPRIVRVKSARCGRLATRELPRSRVVDGGANRNRSKGQA